MRKNPTREIEGYRVLTGPMASNRRRDGANGAFVIPYGALAGLDPAAFEDDRRMVAVRVVVSDASGWADSGLPGIPWEHVSVSLPCRCPSWAEMDWFKRLFWRDDETVLQLHVPREDHVNHHPYCLHLWRPVGVEIPRPPTLAVGPKTQRA